MLEIKNVNGSTVYRDEPIIRQGKNKLLVNDLTLNNGVYYLVLQVQEEQTEQPQRQLLLFEERLVSTAVSQLGLRRSRPKTGQQAIGMSRGGT